MSAALAGAEARPGEAPGARDDVRTVAPADVRGGRRPRRALALGALALAAAAAAAAPWWGPRALGELSFFRARRVEFDGLRYAAPAELLARLGADTTTSVWADLEPMAERVRAHPLVADARVERRLPGVLRVRVVEKEPVAAAAGASGTAFYDSAGAALPIGDAAAAGVDVPLVAAPDGAALRPLLRVLAALRAEAPALYARVSEASAARPARGARRPTGRDPAELVFALTPPRGAGGAAAAGALVVRAGADVTPQRFGDLAPVERDLARRGARPAELDLRYRDQVVARLP